MKFELSADSNQWVLKVFEKKTPITSYFTRLEHALTALQNHLPKVGGDYRDLATLRRELESQQQELLQECRAWVKQLYQSPVKKKLPKLTIVATSAGRKTSGPSSSGGSADG